MVGEAHAPKSEREAVSPAFGKYQIFATLGRGGMADVFLSVARGQMGFNKLAVVKRLRPSLAEEISFRNMFVDEARLAARLGHPNIVHTYEVGEQTGVYFIAMEYLEGQPLNKVLKELQRRKEILAPEIAVRIIADALAGLGYAHELRDYDGRPLSIIHRDISPHNIFVTYDGHTKLLDFGIAKAALSSTETEVGVLKGKVAYMSPEQAMGKRIDVRSDLFAMGIVLWELLAQQRLMTGESAANTIHKLMNEPIPRLSTVLPGIDPTLETLVARALERDPEARWQTAAEMRAALETWLCRQPRQMRQEDVSRKMIAVFGAVREQIQHQIQVQMAAITSAPELHPLTGESFKEMEQPSGANGSGQRPRPSLAGSPGGSGVFANDGGLTSNPSAYPSRAPSQSQELAPQKSSNALLIVITIGCFVIAALLILVVGLRNRKNELARGASIGPSIGTVTSLSTSTDSRDHDPPSTPPPPKTHGHAPLTPPPMKTVVSPPKPSPAPTPLAPVESPGFLTVASYPWAKVTEGSKVICPITPCNKVQMSPGAHSLTFENGDQPGEKQTVSVQVKSGETTTKSIGFK